MALDKLCRSVMILPIREVTAVQHHDYADQLRNSQQVAFTGAQTPIPTPEPALNAFVTRLAGNAKELEMVIDRIYSAVTKIDGCGEAATPSGSADGRGAPCSYLTTHVCRP